MKKTPFALSAIMPVMALSSALCFTSQLAPAQSAPDSSRNTSRNAMAQPRSMHPVNSQKISQKTSTAQVVKASGETSVGPHTSATRPVNTTASARRPSAPTTMTASTAAKKPSAAITRLQR